MTLGDGLYAHLSAVLSVGDRVYPLTLPRGAVPPAVVYQLVGGEGPLHSHGDTQGGDRTHHPTFQRSRVQLGCWAVSARAAEVLAAEVQSAVDGFAGAWGDVPIASALVDTSLDDWRPDVGTYRRIVKRDYGLRLACAGCGRFLYGDIGRYRHPSPTCEAFLAATPEGRRQYRVPGDKRVGGHSTRRRVDELALARIDRQREEASQRLAKTRDITLVSRTQMASNRRLAVLSSPYLHAGSKSVPLRQTPTR